jgi:histidine triad (HIT) family protein
MSDCLFCKMASGEMQVPKLHDDELVFALKDINPRAPVHLLVIPKQHVPTAADLGVGHGELLGRMFEVAAEVARAEGTFDDGYRTAFNVGANAGMTVPHLHLHVLGGGVLGPEG